MNPTPTRTVRKGSLWRNRWGNSIRVQFRRGAYVAYLVDGCRQCGGVLPYADFLAQHEWLAGR